MVNYYNIAGRKIGSHHLAMGILGGLFGSIYLASSGGSKKQVVTPPINAGSKDEEKFIQDFLKSVEGEQKAGH
ncbi:hypothetical protein TMatcc_007635 [Talaromyces marneffei ATCC 18224]|uniref:ATP synthase subunit K, mitochondrial n=2 Tax=Talaromyces marneffei TaxID=37727 RepID=B6QGE7_TALMQ|nr:uncharacterized protein EYB26_004574 [Talaromyces marneffei]EEA24532.1 conserved hypothetical protein [Talaromyces marneffei ATCC 18224]KAE8552964.1 hypothetical protein EYB25_004343 [Talaromyces marneffei]QGA16904.1 hypothetical protein EYB26_004574 [Talaromyces marneffei]